MSVVVGDKVLVPEYGGTKLTFDNEVKWVWWCVFITIIIVIFFCVGLHATEGW